ncbi:MAG TPA: DinB family protein [Terracidiphilus sp.]|nr:DinB family protein [Terracidiphilus sp.]
MDALKELSAEFDRESANVRKTLVAIPDNADFDYKPHDKSMTLGRLAAHVSDTCGDWAVHALAHNRLEWTPEMRPKDPPTKAELLARFDAQLADAKAALATMTQEKWDSNWKFVAGDQTWIDDTKYNVFRTWVLDHLIHHRAQLGVYLRLLGAPVPGCYGPSADES